MADIVVGSIKTYEGDKLVKTEIKKNDGSRTIFTNEGKTEVLKKENNDGNPYQCSVNYDKNDTRINTICVFDKGGFHETDRTGSTHFYDSDGKGRGSLLPSPKTYNPFSK
jgi:hypothetical protein